MDTLVRLRLAVIGLGERAPAPWWLSRISHSPGLSFLQRITPRSELKAAFWTGSAAARRVHDSAIGVGGVSHLFRLPYTLEEALQEHWEHVGEEEAARLLTTDEALALLEATAGDLARSVQEGPVKVGGADVFMTPRGHALIASHYLSAFTRRTRVLPYAPAPL